MLPLQIAQRKTPPPCGDGVLPKDLGGDLLRVAPVTQKKTPDLSIRRLG
jgi:hypothetical protein